MVLFQKFLFQRMCFFCLFFGIGFFLFFPFSSAFGAECCVYYTGNGETAGGYDLTASDNDIEKKLGCVDVDEFTVEKTTDEVLCAEGKAAFKDKAPGSSKLLVKLADTTAAIYTQYMTQVLQSACCLPTVQGKNLSCHAPIVYKGVIKGVIQKTHNNKKPKIPIYADKDIADCTSPGPQTNDIYFQLLNASCNSNKLTKIPVGFDIPNLSGGVAPISQICGYVSPQNLGLGKYCLCQDGISGKVCIEGNTYAKFEDCEVEKATKESKCLKDAQMQYKNNAPALYEAQQQCEKIDPNFTCMVCPDTPPAVLQSTPWILPDASSLNQLGNVTIQQLLGKVIKTVMGIVGTIAFLMCIYGGLLWMTASGNSEKESKAMHILAWAAMGIIVIFASYALVDFVFEAFR